MRIVVIGAGAAGLMAAAVAAKRSDAEVLILEKNGKTGTKILMSGGTRCNLTHDTDAKGIADAFGKAKRFLQPSLGAYSPTDLVADFNRMGVRTKTESTGKIFPISNRAVEVRDALHRDAVDAGVKILLRTPVRDLSWADGHWNVKTDHDVISAERVIVTAGGRSWPGCGTTGDAYQWLERLGHTIVTPRPALVPLVGGYSWTHDLSGLTLEDCIATVDRVGPNVKKKDRRLIQRRSSWLFTHFGFSGPAAMDVSGYLTDAESYEQVSLSVDLIPTLSHDEAKAILADRSDGKQRVARVLGRHLPSRLAQAIAERAQANVSLSELSKKAGNQIIDHLKHLAVPITGTKGFAKAEVTAGGITLGEVDPKTMSSRKAEALFIAGEVLDVDGWIGGYNFQAAFSTGRAAGISAATG